MCVCDTYINVCGIRILIYVLCMIFLYLCIIQVLTCIPVLGQLLYLQNAEVLCHACWTAAFIADGPNTRIQKIVDGGLVKRLVELMLHHSKSVVVPALRAVGNILTGDDLQTQVNNS